MNLENGSVRAVAMSVEMEAFLDNAMNNQHVQHPDNHQSEDMSLAPNAAELEEEEGAIDEVEEAIAKRSSTSWLRTLWIISLYIPFLIQVLFGASFYLIRTLLLGYLLQYAVQFCTVAEHWTFQWLGIENYGKYNSTPLPVLMGLGILTLLALFVHPDGYTWVVLRKIRCAPICFDCNGCDGWAQCVPCHCFTWIGQAASRVVAGTLGHISFVLF